MQDYYSSSLLNNAISRMLREGKQYLTNNDRQGGLDSPSPPSYLTWLVVKTCTFGGSLYTPMILVP